MSTPLLYGYYRSSAAYRVRIALAFKNIAYDSRPIHLVKGDQRSTAFRAVNAQGLVPALSIDGALLAQSQAIIEYLEETRPQPSLLPGNAQDRAQIRRLAQMIVADIHPLNNTRVTAYLRDRMAQPDQAVTDWIGHWMTEGFQALEALTAGLSAGFCFGDQPSLADLCLVPQIYNARRFQVDLTPFPTLVAIDARCAGLQAFALAHPDRQSDAPPP